MPTYNYITNESGVLIIKTIGTTVTVRGILHYFEHFGAVEQDDAE